MKSCSFDDWLRAWFDHPESWDWQLDEDLPQLSPRDTLDYATQLFQNAGELLAPYSDTQIGNSLYGFINEMGSPLYALRDNRLSLKNRRECLSSSYRVFDEIFVPRCSENLGNRSERGGELHSTCYMWWDIFPLYTGAAPDLDDVAITVMERTLALPHAACQESALHGLGHWHRGDQAHRIEAIIDDFLQHNRARRPELVVYAKNAREGAVL